MAIDLGSVNAKIARAEQHIQTVRAECLSLGKLNSHRVEVHVDPDHKRWSFVHRLQSNTPNLEPMSLLIGDGLYNLRCALDHLAFAVVAVEHKGAIPTGMPPMFMLPIADDEPTYRGQVERRKLANVLSTKAIDTFESIQPYHRPYPVGNQVFPGLLAALRDLHNTDKHKLIHATHRVGGGGGLMIEPSDGATFTHSRYGGWRVDDGTELCSVTSDVPAPNMKYHFNISFAVAIEYRGEPGYLPGMLEEMLAEVRRVVAVVNTVY